MSSIALITGAARGMGRAIANSLATDCRGIVLADLDHVFKEAAEARAKTAPSGGASSSSSCPFLEIGTDVTNRESLGAAFEKCKAEFGAYPNVVVANAGILYPTRILDVSFEEWRKVMAVNLDGVFNTVQLGVKNMVRGFWSVRSPEFVVLRTAKLSLNLWNWKVRKLKKSNGIKTH